MREGDENSDYFAKDFSSSNLVRKQKTIIPKKYLIIGGVIFLIIIITIIIITITFKFNPKNNNENNKEIIGQINCIYKNEISVEQIHIISESYEKISDFDILIDGKEIKFTKIYEFSDLKEHKIEYHLYEPINMNDMFKDISTLISIEMISNKNASIISMMRTFENCINLQSFMIHGFNLEKIVSLEKLFFNTKIKYIDLNIFNNIQIEDISYMFALSTINKFNFSEINFNTIKNISHLFENCTSLETIEISSNINLEKLEDISYMFRGCESLTSLDLSNFIQTNNVKDMSHIFQDCILLKY